MTAYNLCHMESEFKVTAEWHFFATCHGKGPCDAVGGVLKRNAAKASLQGHLITSARDLYLWATSKPDSKITYAFFSETDYKKMDRKIKSRYTKVKQISGTQSFHCFKPIDKSSLIVKKYSLSSEEIKVKI